MSDGYRELIESGSFPIDDMAMKCEQVFSKHERALVGISGGADSDVMLDVCERVRQVSPIELIYDWDNTGIEYQATKRHLDYLEERYGVTIHRTRPEKSIPTCAREFGQPFVSKMVSRHMGTLQRGGFEWEDKPFAILKLWYPTIAESTLKWWTNHYKSTHGAYSSYCIGKNKWLKEFVMSNPPWFRISNECCNQTKKLPSARNAREWNCDLKMVGVRKAEGGVRSLSDKCYLEHVGGGGISLYRPLFWLTNEDKAAYDRMFGIVHSDCYTVWGFKRTGCVGCPYGRTVLDDLETAGRFEPKLVAAAKSVFADSYEYTRQFNEFKAERKAGDQMSLDI
jgi:3'-phosphoadenosine 5'-phosphosulfate sulfotransferase (PAPS reductase)/FAD synthetase